MNTFSAKNPNHLGDTLFSLFVLVGIELFFLLVSNALAFGTVMPMVDFNVGLVEKILLNPQQHIDGRSIMLLVQSIVAIFTFIVAPMAYIRWERNTRHYEPFIFDTHQPVYAYIAVILLTIFFMPVNSVFILWNSQLDFPAWLNNFEIWAKAKEENLKILTNFLLKFNNNVEFVLGMAALAVIPGIGEELLFRGVLQNKLKQLLHNPHVAIWLTAIIFSGIHFQFYGFVPRMLLGAMFGYIYHWTKNLWLPIVGHFINNGFTLLMVHFYHQGLVNTNLEEPKALEISYVMVASTICTFLFYILYRTGKNANLNAR